MDYNSTWNSSYVSPWTRNALLVTKGAVQDSDAFRAYYRPEYAPLRERCDAALTGEDILMAFVQARELDAEFHTVCLATSQQCQPSAGCAPKQGSLGRRSSYRRQGVRAEMFARLGSPLVNGTRKQITGVLSSGGVCASLDSAGNTGRCPASATLRPHTRRP